MSKKSKYEGYFIWSVMTGLIFGIVLTTGQDISETGIASTILKAINDVLPIQGYIWIQVLIAIVSVFSLLFEAYLIWQDGVEATIMAISAFLGIFLIVIGAGFGVELLQNVGVFSFILSMLVEGYLIASER